MEKKSYIVPATEVSLAEVEQIIAASVQHVGGDATDLGIGTGETPTDADVKGVQDKSLWDNEW